MGLNMMTALSKSILKEQRSLIPLCETKAGGDGIKPGFHFFGLLDVTHK